MVHLPGKRKMESKKNRKLRSQMKENLIEEFTELKRNKEKKTQNEEKKASNWRQNAKYYYQI